MNKMNNNFSYSFESPLSTEFIFETLLDVRKWWYGIYNETIAGASKEVNNEFNFKAGGGMHNTTQKLIEVVPGKKITWLVTNAHLAFVDKTDEWAGTKFYFELSKSGDHTKIAFTHEGLRPGFECYESCSGGWMQYLIQLERKLNKVQTKD